MRDRACADVAVVAGARPNFVKVAPLLRAIEEGAGRRALFVVTGQHRDDAMSQGFLRDLKIRRPDVDLGASAGSNARHPDRLLAGLTETFSRCRPRRVLVVGDVNSSLAGALAAAKLGIPVDHVEAGLRSRDRTMPEEANRLAIDGMAHWLFATEPDAVRNLLAEGHARSRIRHVGNVMIDSLAAILPAARALAAHRALGLDRRGYGIVTLHRPSNVDDPARLRRILSALERVALDLPLVFPIHPRTRRLIGVWPRNSGIRTLAPCAYPDFVSLLDTARLVITDSGGIQEETTYLRVPCLTLRRSTERPVTVVTGSNRVLGADPARLGAAVRSVLRGPERVGRRPRLWNGRTAERIATILFSDPA